MANRIAGIGSITVDGTQYALRANLVISPDPVEREGLAGQDRVHGFRELPRVPFIEADLSVTPDTTVEDFVTNFVGNSTVVAAMADGRTFALHQAWFKAPSDINTHD